MMMLQYEADARPKLKDLIRMPIFRPYLIKIVNNYLRKETGFEISDLFADFQNNQD